jgi:endonuclease G
MEDLRPVDVAASQRLAAKDSQWASVREHVRTGTVRYLDKTEQVQARINRLLQNPLIEKNLAIRGVADEFRTRVVDEFSPAAESALERLIGGADFLPIWFLTRGAELRRTVARVRARNAAGREMPGTGFLVAPRLLLTNFHVLDWSDIGLPALAEIAPASLAEFDFEEQFNGLMQPVATFPLQPHTLLLASSWDQLDYALVAVEPQSIEARAVSLDDFGYNRLAGDLGKINKGEPVYVVQHPNGQPKQVVLQNNLLIDRDEHVPYLTYEADTEKGSSGSPVFNRQWEVIALHHAPQIARDADGNILARDGSLWTPSMGATAVQYLKLNEGVRISRILTDLAQKLDALRTRGLNAIGPQERCTTEGLALLEAALQFRAGVSPVVIGAPTGTPTLPRPTPPHPPSSFPRPD